MKTINREDRLQKLQLKNVLETQANPICNHWKKRAFSFEHRYFQDMTFQSKTLQNLFLCNYLNDDIFFAMKSIELDLRLKLPFGTIFAYEREKHFKQ